MEPNPVEVVSVLRDAGIIGALVVALVGGARKWWVFGWIHRETQEDRDFWRDTALRALNVGEAAVRRRPDA